jgi:hypothetical protein
MGQVPEEVTVPIVETAADVLGTGVEDLPPLSESVPIDGLDAVVADPTQDVTVTFTYAGLRVLVRSGGTVYVSPALTERTGAERR